MRKYLFLAFFSLFFLSCHKNTPGHGSGSTDNNGQNTNGANGSTGNTNEPPKHGPVTGIQWDTEAKKISHDVGYAEYGRMYRIGGDTLILCYHSGPFSNTFFGVDIAVRHSFDNGKTWSAADILMKGPQSAYYGFQNPEMIILKNGWLLLSFVGRGKPDTNENDNVQLMISKDRGKTWGDARIIVTGRSWEPAMIQLPDGTIDLFYSSEARWFPSANVQQEILMISSADNGLTWTTPKSVAYSSGNRDGMAVPVILKDQKGVIFAIESVGNSKSPWIIWSSLENNFNYAELPTVDNSRRWNVTVDNIWGGAPYLLQLKTGETVLCCQYTGNRNIGPNWKKSTMVVFIGDGEGKNFGKSSFPWPNLPVNEGAYFSSLFLKNDSTLAMITTRNFPDNHSEIWIKEGHIQYKY